MKTIFYTPIIAALLSLIAGLMLLSACAALGLPTANGFNEKIVVSYATVEGVTRSTTVLLNAEKISVGDAENVLAQVKYALLGIDLARSMAKTDLTTAEMKLDAAQTILKALQAYITTKEQK